MSELNVYTDNLKQSCSGYSDRQIIMLGDSHGWGQGSPNYQGASSGYSVHTPWIHNSGFYGRLQDYLYYKFDSHPWRYIPGNDDETTFTASPTFLKGRYYIYSKVKNDYLGQTEKDSLNAYCNAETRCESLEYKYNSDIGLLGKNVFVLAPDIDRLTPESYQVTAFNQTKEGWTMLANNSGGVTDTGLAFVTIRGDYCFLPGWIKTSGQRIYVPELGAVKIDSLSYANNGFSPNSFSPNGFYFSGVNDINLFITHIDDTNISLEELSCVHNGTYIYKSYYEESSVLMKLKTPTRYLTLSLLSDSSYGGKAKIELLDNLNSELGWGNDMYGTATPTIKILSVAGDNRSEMVIAENAVINSTNIIIDTSYGRTEEFYIIDFGQKKQGTVKLSIDEPYSNKNIIQSRGMLCGNNDLIRNLSMGYHDTGAWIGEKPSGHDETGNHIQDITEYMTGDIKSLIIEAPLVNEYLSQTPINDFKQNLTDVLNITQCSDAIIFTTLGQETKEFGADTANVTYEMYAQAANEWALSEGVTFLDCRNYLKDMVSNGVIVSDDLYYDNGHPSPLSNEIMAKMLIQTCDMKY
jgi:hypothetical protein